MIDIPKTTIELLVFEYGKTEDEAKALVKKHVDVIMSAIMGGFTMSSVRAAAMAIEMKERKLTEQVV